MNRHEGQVRSCVLVFGRNFTFFTVLSGEQRNSFEGQLDDRSARKHNARRITGSSHICLKGAEVSDPTLVCADTPRYSHFQKF